VDPEKTSIARQWLGKHIPAATNMHTTEELLEALFSMLSMSRLYNEDQQDKSALSWHL
jgi:hypothetical protein